MARFSTYLALGAGLAGAWLGGCNSVLGIEEPVPKEGGSSSTGGNVGVTSVTSLSQMNAACDQPTAGCKNCVAGACTSELAACLQVESCRNALSAYRKCLGPNGCDPGPEDESCLEALHAVMSPEADNLSTCLTPCRGICRTSSLASICQMYCGCMALNCSSKVQGDCVATCEAVGSFADIACRLDHCSYAPDSLHSATHCEHAVGVGECPRSSVKNDCADGRKASGWRCTKNAECCSGDCSDDEICN